METKVSIALVQEPYVGKHGYMKQQPGTRLIQCTLNRQKPVKAAIIVFGDLLEVIHDPQLVTETEVAAVAIGGGTKLGLKVSWVTRAVSEPRAVRSSCPGPVQLSRLAVWKIGLHNAWSHWWGSVSENDRGVAYSSFLTEIDLQILNTGDTPTFETYRNGKICKSTVDVTACSTSLLGKIEDWKVDANLITSDHNAITFTLRTGKALEHLKPITTRMYNTKKANWSKFASKLKTLLVEKNITTTSVQECDNPEDLENMISTYTEAIHEACETSIPTAGKWKGEPKPPWWSKSLEDLKKDVLRKKRRIRNAAASRMPYVIAEYQKTKLEYSEKAEKAQIESWKEFCTTQEKESMWDKIYRVIKKTSGRQEDMLLRDTAGNTLSPQQSAELLATTFYPDDSESTDQPFHAELREKTKEIPREPVRLYAPERYRGRSL
ncbi:unnamed protein product [Plutella xylostella]|uniref:(diamondback moth) hypothetical protein n=1 Tax=Plutella xylostella TaxID=51655 RepID=A0A8S4GDL5_PLUXY|nr:unnamed protein product [Plutella xylostella]